PMPAERRPPRPPPPPPPPPSPPPPPPPPPPRAPATIGSAVFAIEPTALSALPIGVLLNLDGQPCPAAACPRARRLEAFWTFYATRQQNLPHPLHISVRRDWSFAGRC